MMFDFESLQQAYRQDGAVFLAQALDAHALSLARAAFDWSVGHPGPAASRPFEESQGAFYQDLCNPAAPQNDHYRRLFEETPLTEIVTGLWADPEIWFMYEQIFLKEGDASRRSPWHQDAPYLCVEGNDLAVAWITFDSVPKQDSLEFVRASHRGTVYNTSKFDGDDDTEPLYEGLPRLPDIEADRAAWDILSWDVEPGDLLVFHPAMLHGGAGTRAGARRRTLSLRFFGGDAVYVERPGGGVAPMVEGLRESLQPGAPFRHPAFPKLAPKPRGVALPINRSG
jgi:ectoine hydroxylase-related dioxygenase (phytanoyl-CoA dioxygenase family)